jgi:hypothetical protein
MGRNWPLTLARSLNVDIGPVDLGLGNHPRRAWRDLLEHFQPSLR